MKIASSCVLAVAVAYLAACGPTGPTPPVATVAPQRLEIHGDVRVDDYYWLRERENPDVVAYLDAENAYMDQVMMGTQTLQKTLFNEIRTRIKQTDSSVPVRQAGYLYYERTEDGQEYPIHCRREDRPGSPEQLLLDVNRVADGHGFCSVRGLEVAPASDMLAYAVDTVGRRTYTLRFKNLSTGDDLTDRIAGVTGNSAWFNDGRTLLYTRQDPETLRWYQVWRHELGTDVTDDVLVYEEDDDTFSVEVTKTMSGRFLLITSEQTLATEVRFLDAGDPAAEPTLVAPRERGVEYQVAHHGDRFLIRTNLDAPNFRLMDAPIAAPVRASWHEIVPHRDDVLLEGVTPFRGFLVLDERRDALPRLVVVDVATGDRHEIGFDESAHLVRVDDNREYDTSTLRLGYASLTTPDTIFDYDMATRTLTMRKQDQVLGGYDPDDYISERLWATASDGVGVPISIVHRRDLPRDGSAPLLLYGYGSYGFSSEPSFDPSLVSLLDRGVSYAIAHVRGGQERGRWWYEDGKLLHKRNTFTDFIDCARYLIDEGFTSADRLVAQGGSAGGLLVGAVVNMAPDLFAGAVAHVPFVDVVTTMLDDSIPLTSSEWDEWGDPRRLEYYRYMLSYSPYDNVGKKDYPAMLVTTGLHDSQVQYWEPAKWVAKLRASKTDTRRLLLRTNMEAGHGGASGRYQEYRELAEEYAFILQAVGLD